MVCFHSKELCFEIAIDERRSRMPAATAIIDSATTSRQKSELGTVRSRYFVVDDAFESKGKARCVP
jgi:hypothetical protein